MSEEFPRGKLLPFPKNATTQRRKPSFLRKLVQGKTGKRGLFVNLEPILAALIHVRESVRTRAGEWRCRDADYDPSCWEHRKSVNRDFHHEVVGYYGLMWELA